MSYQLEPQPAKKSGCLGKIVKGVLIVIGLFVALVVIVAIIPSSKPATTTTAPAQAGKITVAPVLVATVEPTLAPTTEPLPVIGQDVIVDEVRWKILSAESLGNKITDDNQFTKDLTTSGKFVKVRFEIENRSKDMLSYVGLNLLDAQGRKYTSSSNAFSAIDDSETCIIENLNPNITKICTHIYEVPADATGLKANVSDLKMFGSAEKLIDLGM